MNAPQDRVDKPEPRWQALLGFLAIGAIYVALPSNLVVGPTWLLPTAIVVLLVPTVVSHRVGKLSLNRALGVLIRSEEHTSELQSRPHLVCRLLLDKKH